MDEVSDSLKPFTNHVTQCFCSKVKVLYKFSQMGHLDLPQRNERLTKLLQEILLVHSEDLPILQYWRSALSKEYKNHLKQSQ